MLYTASLVVRSLQLRRLPAAGIPFRWQPWSWRKPPLPHGTRFSTLLLFHDYVGHFGHAPSVLLSHTQGFTSAKHGRDNSLFCRRPGGEIIPLLPVRRLTGSSRHRIGKRKRLDGFGLVRLTRRVHAAIPMDA